MTRNIKEGRVQRSISVPESVYRAIEDMAHEKRISVNEMVVRALEQAGKHDAAPLNAQMDHQKEGTRRGIQRSA